MASSSSRVFKLHKNTVTDTLQHQNFDIKSVSNMTAYATPENLVNMRARHQHKANDGAVLLEPSNKSSAPIYTHATVASPTLPLHTRTNVLAVIIPPVPNSVEHVCARSFSLYAPEQSVNENTLTFSDGQQAAEILNSSASQDQRGDTEVMKHTDSSATVVEKGWLTTVLDEMHSASPSTAIEMAPDALSSYISCTNSLQAQNISPAAQSSTETNIPSRFDQNTLIAATSLQSHIQPVHESNVSKPAQPKSIAPCSRYYTPRVASAVEDTINTIAPTKSVSGARTPLRIDTKLDKEIVVDPQNTAATSIKYISKSDTTSGHVAPKQPPPLPPHPFVPTGRKYIGDWSLGKTIGEGSSGKVKLAENIVTGEKCVVKAVRRPKMSSGETVTESDLHSLGSDALGKIYKRELYMIREAALGAMLDHPNIVKLHSAVLGENHFYCFFEHIVGEDLVDYITRCGRIKETPARGIFRQVLSAIDYAHRNYVVHRDIKLENIRYNEKTGMVKLLDFGFATFHTEKDMLLTNCGSPCYAAPEIYDNKPYHGPEVDIWSLGVCLYGMITGSLPFDGPTFRLLASRVRAGKITFPNYVSESAENLITSMLTVIPRKRATLEHVLQHPWVNQGYRTRPATTVDPVSKESTAAIQMELVNRVLSANVCDAGCHLMNMLKERIPERQQQMEAEWRQASTQATSENQTKDSESLSTQNNASSSNNVFCQDQDTNCASGTTNSMIMLGDESSILEISEEFDNTVHDKNRIWWKRLLHNFGRHSPSTFQSKTASPGSTSQSTQSEVFPSISASPSKSISSPHYPKTGGMFGNNQIKPAESISPIDVPVTQPLLTRIFRRRVATTSTFTDPQSKEIMPDMYTAARPTYRATHGRAYTQNEAVAYNNAAQGMASSPLVDTLDIRTKNEPPTVPRSCFETECNEASYAGQSVHGINSQPTKGNTGQRTWFPQFRIKRRQEKA
ncbi:hypothetical protein BDV3_000521 [Batrachochytrium dendrobatidis]|uniref:non-specific serine/threonine protein kinase n=1 Tax=Batrachochytrium dendrobatidis (strain JEL423) TaxID=403673 RepID=A0A177WCT9_BATDL|nr:hypothetical protein BDEG_21555 [Batrachochytrium dendrobatidis JEL423]